jgi:hypothetical protein
MDGRGRDQYYSLLVQREGREGVLEKVDASISIGSIATPPRGRRERLGEGTARTCITASGPHPMYTYAYTYTCIERIEV